MGKILALFSIFIIALLSSSMVSAQDGGVGGGGVGGVKVEENETPQEGEDVAGGGAAGPVVIIQPTEGIKNYAFESKIGGNDKGSTDYKFNTPLEVAVDSSGNVYVADSGNDRIMVYDSSLNFIKKFTGDFNEPRLIEIKNDNIFIVDEETIVNEVGDELKWGRVRKFNSNGDELLKFTNLPEESTVYGVLYFHPAGIAIDSVGRIFLSQQSTYPEANKVHMFDSNGNYESSFSDYNFNRPQQIEFDRDDNLFISDFVNDRIVLYDKNLNYVGSIKGGFNHPGDIAFDSEGNLFVIDVNNARIQIFDRNKNYIGTIAGNGAGYGDNQLYLPSGLDVDASGNVYVVNALSHKLQVFSKIAEAGGGDAAGPVITCQGCLYNGNCVSVGTKAIIENVSSYCDIDKEWKSQRTDGSGCQNSYECLSNVCENNRCGVTCDGCIDENNNCLPFGQRLKIDEISAYCSIDSVFRPQMPEGAECENDYECGSNECGNGKCISTYSLLEKIFELLKKIFGKGWLWGK